MRVYAFNPRNPVRLECTEITKKEMLVYSEDLK